MALSLCLSQVSRRSGSVGTSGPLPHFQGCRPPEFPGRPWTCRMEGGGVGSSMRFLDTGPGSLPPTRWPGIGDSPHPSLAARPQGGMSRGYRSRITGLALGISPGGQAGLLAQPQAPAGRAQGTRSLGLLTQGNPLQSRAGLDPGLPWRPVLEPVQASHPLLSPRAAWPGGRPRARGTADCGGLGLGVRTRAHVAFSNELWV